MGVTNRGWSCGAGIRTVNPYNFSFEGKKFFGIAEEGYARSKLRYWPLLQPHLASAFRPCVEYTKDKNVRIRLILSPRTPPVLGQGAQIRDLHHNTRVRIREEGWCGHVRIQEGQPETPPAAGSVIIAATERHLV